MPKKISDYTKSAIYYAYYNDELWYIGSTTNFTQRKAYHKKLIINKEQSKRTPFHRAFDELIINFDNLRWEKEDVSFQTKSELERHEGIKIREFKPKYNFNIPGRTIEEKKEINLKTSKQWKINNSNKDKQRNKIYNQKYRDENKKQLNIDMKERRINDFYINCECGGKFKSLNQYKHKKSLIHREFIESQDK